MMISKLLSSVTIGQALFDAPALFNRLYRYDWYGGTLRQWVADLELLPQTKLLELGCGPGNLSDHLAVSGFEITGADKSGKMIKRARKNRSKAIFVEANAYELPFTNHSFDAVISASLINVVPEPDKMAAEIYRVLRPNGIASVLFPTPQFDPDKARQISQKRNIKGLSASSLSVWAGVAKKLDAETVREILVNSGFVVEATTYYLDDVLAAIRARKT